MESKEMLSLSQERKNPNFNIEKLTHIIYDGEENTKKRKQITKILEKDPIMRKDRIFLSHDQQYLRAAEKVLRLNQIMKENNLSIEDRTRLIVESGFFFIFTSSNFFLTIILLFFTIS